MPVGLSIRPRLHHFKVALPWRALWQGSGDTACRRACHRNTAPAAPASSHPSPHTLCCPLTHTSARLPCIFRFAARRLPSPHPSLIRWSAPAFVTISLSSLGLSLGSHTVRSFTACLANDLRLMLSQHGRRSVAGLEAAISLGGLQHKADLIAAPTTSVRTGGCICGCVVLCALQSTLRNSA